jgi:polyketide synthase 7
VFIEASPHPVLTLGMQETFEHAGVDAATVPTLRRDNGDQTQVAHALAQAFTTGVGIDWKTWFPADPTPRVVDLPTYAFQRRRYWLADVLPLQADPGADGEAAEFWAAVERGDLGELSGMLRLTDEDALGAILPALSGWRRERRDRSTLDAWRYRFQWRRITDLAGGAPAGPWLVVRPPGEAGGWADACAAALGADGGPAVTIEVGEDTGREELATLLRTGHPSPAGVLSLLALDDRATPPGVAPGLTGTLTLLQALVDAGVETPLWCASRGAVSVEDSGPLDSPEQAQLWGLGRVAALEHPAHWGGLLDLPASPAELDPAHLRAVLTGTSGEDQVALRAAGAFGRRLAPAGDRAPEAGWRSQGTVLVTGGTGGLAAHVARWLAGNGAERVVLLAPGGPDAPGAQDLAAELSELGAEALIADCDETDEAGVEALVEQLSRADARIETVIHTAGSGELAPLTELTGARLADAVQAETGWRLAELCGLGKGDTVVFFTSVAAVWGSRDHGAYAAANAYLDALARCQRADGARAISVAWGLWDLTDGTDEQSAAVAPHAERSRRQGLSPLDPGLALTALGQVLADDEPNLAIADVTWETFAPLFTMERASRLLDGVPAARQALEAAGDGDDTAASSEALRRELAAAAEDERAGILLALVRAHAAGVLRYQAAEHVGPDRPFKELGFDSIAAVELRNRLRAATGVSLSPTAAFDHPTPGLLAAYLLTQVMPDETEDPALGHLDGLENALAVLAPEDPRRTGLVNRMRTLLWKYESGAEEPGEAAEGSDLTTASADDMFALIDRELGA